MGLRSSLKVNRGRGLRMHGRARGRAPWPSTRSDHKDPRLGASNGRTIEREREGLQDIMNELRGVYHRRSRPKRGERIDARGPRAFWIGMLQEGLVDNAGMGGC